MSLSGHLLFSGTGGGQIALGPEIIISPGQQPLCDVRKTVIQGNTGALYKVGVLGDPDLSVDWTCQISVPSAVPPVSRFITALVDNNTRFAVQVTAAETAAMRAGRMHTIAVQVQNLMLVPPFIVELPVEFFVNPQLIP